MPQDGGPDDHANRAAERFQDLSHRIMLALTPDNVPPPSPREAANYVLSELERHHLGEIVSAKEQEAALMPEAQEAEAAPTAPAEPATPTGKPEQAAGIMTLEESGLAYISILGDAYQRHVDEQPWWRLTSDYPRSLTVPEPQNVAQQAALKTYLDSFEQKIGFRPEILFETSITEPAEAMTFAGEPERPAGGENFGHTETMRAAELEAAAQGAVDHGVRFGSRLFGWIAGRVENSVQHLADMIAPPPKMTAQQVHDHLQAHVGNLEKDHALAFEAAQQEQDAAKAEEIFRADRQQQQADLSLAQRFGRNATREANIGREHDREPDREYERD